MNRAEVEALLGRQLVAIVMGRGKTLHGWHLYDEATEKSVKILASDLLPAELKLKVQARDDHCFDILSRRMLELLTSELPAPLRPADQPSS